MTVLEAEDDTDERPGPPKKKLCLSLTRSSESRKQSFASHSGSQADQESKKSTENLNATRFRSFFLTEDKMLSDFPRIGSTHRESNCDVSSNLINSGHKIASLCNLGNTCFLNSVLYTLRFTPSFLHNLHHLAKDLTIISEKQLQIKSKISSLGRIGVPSTTINNRSWSSKDLTSFTSASITSEFNKPRIQVATEKLHELYVCLKDLEGKENNNPFQPDAFLQALREVNPIFEGNQQQDAHELLVCILDNIRESFQLLVKQRENQLNWRSNSPLNSNFSSRERIANSKLETDNNAASKRSTRKSLKKKKGSIRASSASSVSNNKSTSSSSGLIVENGCITPTMNGDITPPNSFESKKCFISEDFEGVSLLRTTCLECEQVTERKETFCDICVPVDIDRSNEKDEDGKNMDSAIYRKAVVTSELLYDKNKYWCANCLRYNEARRAICYPSLPRLLILQLKRFSTNAGSMEKINNHMPTPLTLQCFCEECNLEQKKHMYNLYSVIMHQGATMTAGHYVAYTKLPGESAVQEYLHCNREISRVQRPPLPHGHSDNHKITAFLNCFGAKASVTDNKEQLIRKGCRSNDCCGLKQINKHESTWLECDDEAVRVIPVKELQDKLAPNHRNSATPYLLFYVRSNST